MMKLGRSATMAIVAVLAAMMCMPLVSATTVPMSVNIGEPVPQIAVEVSESSIDFGSVFPGESSEPRALTVTNVGSTSVKVTCSVTDDGPAVFVPGLTVNEAGWNDYESILGDYESDPLQLQVSIPQDTPLRGEKTGDITFWAVEATESDSMADFSADVTSGVAPLTVHFTDLSSHGANSWDWDFDNDGIVDSHDQNPTFLFTEAGTFTVNLTVSNGTATDYEKKTNYITVTAAAPGEWPLFRKDVQLTGIPDSAAPTTDALKWTSSNIGAVIASSVTVAEGKVFVNCGKWMNALDMYSGTVLWNVSTGYAIGTGSWDAPVYDNGMVFKTGDGCRDASNGELLWSFDCYAGVNGSPLIVDGKVIVNNFDGGASDDPTYYCFDESNGELLWSFDVYNQTRGGPGWSQSTPCYYNGYLYFGAYDWNNYGAFFCVDIDDGQKIWSRGEDGTADSLQAFCGSATVQNDVVYVSTYNFNGKGKLYALDWQDGHTLWSQSIQRSDSVPFVSEDKVYVTGGCAGYSPHQTYCFYASNGTLAWSTTTDQDIGGWTCTMTGADGLVFVGQEEPGSGMVGSYSGIYALNAETGDVVWSSELGGGTPVLVDGILFTVDDGRVYAFSDA